MRHRYRATHDSKFRDDVSIEAVEKHLDRLALAINRTLVAPYSARAARGAPVSVPLRWDELDDPDLRPDRWTIGTIMERVTAAGDPFAELLGLEQRLPAL